MCSLYKYSDHSAIADFSNSGRRFNQQVTEVTRWRKDNYLDLNVDRTRDMAVDLRKKGDVMELNIEGVTIAAVNEYKYLATVLDNQLTFECNTNNIVKKCHQRMSSMFNRLRSFGVSRMTLHIFYCSFIESVLTPCLNCLLVWYFEYEE